MQVLLYAVALLNFVHAQGAVCSMSGQLAADGSCVCDAGFEGPHCAALRFGFPETPNAGLNSTFPQSNQAQWTWGGSPIQADDGKYHLFFSWFRFKEGMQHTIKNWYRSSVIAHAVSDHPGGRFQFVDVVVEPRGGDFFDGTTAHNPTVVRLPDGSFAIYYIGLNCNTRPGEDCIKHQWIGAAHATNLNGPWQRLSNPVLSGEDGQAWEGGMVANPSVIALANGTLLMAYRGLNDRGIGMAVAHLWKDNFTRLNNGAAVLGPESPSQTAVDEDMSMWLNKRGIQMIFHQEGRGGQVGAHAYSTDNGLSWTVAGDAYNLTVATTHGGAVSYSRRERPQFLKGANGQPTHMFSGVQDASGFTHTIAVPLDLRRATQQSVIV